MANSVHTLGAVTGPAGAWSVSGTTLTGTGPLVATTITTSVGNSLMAGNASGTEASPLIIQNAAAYSAGAAAGVTFRPTSNAYGPRLVGYAVDNSLSGFKFITDNAGSGTVALTLDGSANATFAGNIDVTATTRLRGEVVSSLGASNPSGGNSAGWSIQDAGYAQFAANGTAGVTINRFGSDGAAIGFLRQAVSVGSISVTASATAYNTSSDYRLKENIVPLTEAIERIKDLNVCRFNFIAEPERVVDGFIAHEVQEVVPEAIFGEKDAVDEDDNPIYQGIDQSKLVPLLTAALQEAIAKIEALEARVTTLEGA